MPRIIPMSIGTAKNLELMVRLCGPPGFKKYSYLDTTLIGRIIVNISGIHVAIVQ